MAPCWRGLPLCGDCRCVGVCQRSTGLGRVAEVRVGAMPEPQRTYHMGRRLPDSSIEGIHWDDACKHVQQIEERPRIRRRLIDDLPVPTGLREQWACQSLSVREKADLAMQEGARRLQRDLRQRGVLCDQQYPCEVTVVRNERVNASRQINCTGSRREALKSGSNWVMHLGHAPRIRICLPSSRDHLKQTRVCDPWGERWQRNGAFFADAWTSVGASDGVAGKARHVERVGARAKGVKVAGAKGAGRAEPKEQLCNEFDMEGLARWWKLLRSEPAFLNSSSPWLGRHFAAKLLVAEQMDTASFLSGLPTVLSSAHPATKPRRSCAFVGSGHDLRCGKPRGQEIDAHDAVFRANAAQQPEMRARYLSPEMAGSRTDYRVNCLQNSSALPSMRSETCVVPLTWWGQVAGHEHVSNTARPCCDPLTSSSYELAQLRSLVEQGFSLAFLNGGASFAASVPLVAFPSSFGTVQKANLFPVSGITVPSGEFLSNSGGNALYAALAMCDRVDLYGVGLFSKGASGDKVYVHSYDKHAATCASPGKGLKALEIQGGFINGLSYTPKWLRARVRNELFMHVLHAFDLLRWIQ